MTRVYPDGDVRTLLRRHFVWRGDRPDPYHSADPTGWWRTPAVLAELGPALARLFQADSPTVVLGPESRGSLLGPLAALALGVGFVEVRKNRGPAADSDEWLQRTTPPDYRDRHLTLGFRRALVTSGDRVVLVDDWVDTGGQALGVQALTDDAGATWLGVATIVDGLHSSALRRRLGVRSLLHVRDL